MCMKFFFRSSDENQTKDDLLSTRRKSHDGTQNKLNGNHFKILVKRSTFRYIWQMV